jgi:hypothetical protein
VTVVGRWLPKRRREVIILCGLALIEPVFLGVTAMLPVGSASGELAAEPIKPRHSPMLSKIMIYDAGQRHVVQRQGFEGNREFAVVTATDGGTTAADELSLYEKGSFSGASQLLTGERVIITDPANKWRPGYFLNGGHVLGWEHGTDSWAVIRSRGPGEARQRLLNLAGMVVGTEPKPVTAPFSVRYVPPGFVLTHASLKAGDRPGSWLFGLSKGPVREQAQITMTIVPRFDSDDTQIRKSLGRPDSRAHDRQLWYVEDGTPGFTIAPGAAEIVLRRDNCYGHIRIADVALVPRAEQEKIVEGFTLGLCGVEIGWANPFASL